MPETRGRLSSIKLLPPEADKAVAAAVKALGENRRTQESIREELNLRLLALGHEPISSSAFNRYSLKLSVAGWKLQRKREAVAAFVREIGDRPDTDISLLISEMGKGIIYDVIEAASGDDEEAKLSPKELAAIALSYMRFTAGDAKAVKTARDMIDLDDQQTRKELEKVVTAAGKSAGLSDATVRRLRESFLGIKPKPKAEPAASTPSSGPSDHLLPQGEKDEVPPAS
jgi:hypothetical protein